MLPSPDDSRPVRSLEDLLEVFHVAEKPEDAWRIGVEAEKFGITEPSLTPVSYEGSRGILELFARFAERGWQAEREHPEGPVISLTRDSSSITLEPGAQLELSAAAVADVHQVEAVFAAHFVELDQVSVGLDIRWLSVGFHPLARRDELPWVPKQRYVVMREYLPTRGPAALDMMQRTATIQVNCDFANEADALRKLTVALRLSPILHAMTANSPFIEGRLSGKKSLRGEVWLHMDPSRSGLIPSLWSETQTGYLDYVEWALDAGMFLLKRGEQVIANTGQPFRDFLRNGYAGERATLGDWRLHLNSLFPEVRLKNTLEVRGCDALPAALASAIPALVTGLLYDARALDAAEDLARRLDYATVEAARPALVERGLDAQIGEWIGRELAERVLDIALGGLERRRRLNQAGVDERIYLRELAQLVERGRSPADELMDGLGSAAISKLEIADRTRLDLTYAAKRGT